MSTLQLGGGGRNHYDDPSHLCSLQLASQNRPPLLKREMFRLTLLLMLGAILTAILSSLIDGGVTAFISLLGRLARAPSSIGVGYVVYTASVAVLMLSAVAITSLFAPGAAGTYRRRTCACALQTFCRSSMSSYSFILVGSGVGELKMILSGAPIPDDHFSLRYCSSSNVIRLLC